MPNPDQVAIESKSKKNMEKEMHQGKSKQNKVQIARLFVFMNNSSQSQIFTCF